MSPNSSDININCDVNLVLSVFFICGLTCVSCFFIQVVSEPDIETRHVLPGDTALILGCDGIWDVLSNQVSCDC